jgi:tight adherence protein C
MTLILILGLVLAGTSGVLMLRALNFAQAGRRRTLDQIASYGFRSAESDPETPSDLRSVVSGVAATTGERALGRFESLRSREGQLRKLLTSAGMYQTSVASFIGARILATMFGPGILLLCVVTGNLDRRVLLSCGLLTAMGWFLPNVVVQRRARLRVEAIDREVPELVDLLVTTVEAGVGFAAALQLASRSIEGPLGQELRLALREQSLGLTPQEALQNLALRVDSPATQMFTQALLQGESLGVSIGTILRDLAVDMRKRRRQSAEERAQKTPTKILFPLIVLILPAMFIIVMGPAIMDIARFLTV